MRSLLAYSADDAEAGLLAQPAVAAGANAELDIDREGQQLGAWRISAIK